MPYQFAYEDTTIHYQLAGEGPAVLLLHGFGEDSHIFDYLFAALTHRYQVVLPDLPGSGRSPFHAQLCSSIDNMARALHALMASITSNKFVVLGHSMGGYIALAMAQSGADRLQGFGLLHSTAFADSAEKRETRSKAITFIREHGSHAFLKTAIPGLFSESWQQAHPQPVQALVDKGATFMPEALVSYYQAMMARPDRNDVLRSTKLPVLFIIGVHDKAAPMQDVLQQVSLPSVAHVTILEETAHMGMMEEPEKFQAAAEQFLRLWA